MRIPHPPVRPVTPAYANNTHPALEERWRGRSLSAHGVSPLALAGAALMCGCPDPDTGADAEDTGSTTITEGGDPSDSSSNGVELPTSSDADGSGSSGDSEDSAASTSGGACSVDQDCDDPLAPVCVSGECLGCDQAETPEAACSTIDPAKPLCGADGACAQCSAADTTACVGETPICDAATSRCMGCTTHEQCPETACDLETGACFSDDCRIYVHPGFGEHQNVGSALDDVAAGESCVIIVEALDEGAELDVEEPATLEITDDRRIALIGDYWVTPSRLHANEEVLVNVASGGVLYIADLRLEQAYYNTILVEDGTVHLDRAQVTSYDVALRATHPEARVRLRNSTFYGDNGTLTVEDGAVEATFVSLLSSGMALSCGASAAVTVRNSLLLDFWSDGTAVDCSAAEISYSALGVPYPGEGNQSLGSPQPEWFVTASLDHHLSGDHPALLEVTARWTTGDPLVDLDGDARPARDGEMTFAGADAIAIESNSHVEIGAYL